MTAIDFYLIADETPEASFRLACKLIDKAYMRKNSVYVQTASIEEAKMLDDLLWTFRDDAFIPHGLVGTTQLPIQIGQIEAPNPYDVLINLTAATPALSKQYQRILEILPPQSRNIGRKKYKFYRDQNCEITTHDLSV
jgi:DNA polymerase-3 subunit chi